MTTLPPTYCLELQFLDSGMFSLLAAESASRQMAVPGPGRVKMQKRSPEIVFKPENVSIKAG